ncbi:MAG: hypothetical protein U1F08_06985 [Steroidobacteraceae bacterium]
MSDRDWFRQTEWTPSAAAQFQTKLARTRGQRSEYLRIQAWTLADTGQLRNAAPAIELAKQFLEVTKYKHGIAQAHRVMARAFETLGDLPAAIDAYRRAVLAEREFPNARGCAYIDFAWFAARHRMRNVYDEVVAALDSDLQDQDLIFPVRRFRYFGAFALISDDRGDRENAKRMAANALAAAAIEQGPFSRHPGIGLVRNATDGSYEHIERLAR